MTTWSRRDVLISTGAALAAAGWARAAPGESATAPAPALPIGLQLYTIQAELARDLAGSLAAVAAAGYREVESAGLLGRTAAQMRQTLDQVGLRCTSAHGDLRSLLADPERALADAQALGARQLVCAFPWVADAARFVRGARSEFDVIRALWGAFTLDDWRFVAARLSELGERARRAGLAFGYHNHNFELREYRGATALHHLLRETDPELVFLQLDCGWAAAAGADPAALILALGSRVRSLHLKDLRADLRPSFELEAAATTEVGAGVVDWRSVFAAARSVGVTTCYVEQEPPFARPPLEAIRQSHDYLQRLR